MRYHHHKRPIRMKHNKRPYRLPKIGYPEMIVAGIALLILLYGARIFYASGTIIIAIVGLVALTIVILSGK